MNEKTLVKLMKAAYKGGGVKVYRSQHDVLCLCGAGWACALLWKYVPGPVLGLIASWCHGLPDKGQGWWCMDAYGEEPAPVPEIPDPLRTLQNSAASDEGLLTMDLVCKGCQAVQGNDLAILWFDAAGIEMLGKLTRFGGDLTHGPDSMPWGRWHDPETGTVIFLETVRRVRGDLTAKLGEIDYHKPHGGGAGC